MAGREPLGKCPICGKDVVVTHSKKTNRNFYFCTGFEDGCTFGMSEDFKRYSDIIHLTDFKVKRLLEGKKIKETCTSKAGKKYEAYLQLRINNKDGKNYVNLEMESSEK